MNHAEKIGIESDFVKLMKMQLFRIVVVLPSYSYSPFVQDMVDIKVELLSSEN